LNTHYIPQYYLRGFQTSSGSNCVFRYEKTTRFARELPIPVVGMENDLYPPDIEAFLTEEYENPANLVLDKLWRFELPTDEERGALVQYFLLMRERTPFRKKESVAELRERIPERLESLESEKNEALAAHPDKSAIIESNFERIKNLLTSREELKEQIWLNMLVNLNLPLMYNALLMMNWYYIVSPRCERFITSDAPFFFTSGIGLNKPMSEVFFPVSTRMVLWLNWYSLKRQVIESTQSMTNEINKRLVYNASKYVFFSKEEKWLRSFCVSKKLELLTLDLKSLMKN
jgi:hypothetical protein